MIAANRFLTNRETNTMALSGELTWQILDYVENSHGKFLEYRLPLVRGSDLERWIVMLMFEYVPGYLEILQTDPESAAKMLKTIFRFDYQVTFRNDRYETLVTFGDVSHYALFDVTGARSGPAMKTKDL